MPETGRDLLAAADAAEEAGRPAEARDLWKAARFVLQREGDLAGMSALARREARRLEEPARSEALRGAVRLARDAKDTVGEIEGLEDLSREHADAGRVGPAMAILGEIVRLQRARRDRGGEVRGVLLAGRLLCEAWGADKDVGTGLVMLLWAEASGRKVDEGLGRMTRTYIEGFAHALTEREFAAIEPMFDLNHLAVVDATFARYMHEHAPELP